MNCAKPIDWAILADYWLAMLASSEEESIEEHLLECDQCGERLREVIALANGLRSVARDGSLRMIVNESFLQRAAAEGLRVRQYSLTPGSSVQCTVNAEDDILVARLAANLSAAKRIDLCMCDELGNEQFRLPDIPVNSVSGTVLYQESITFAKAAVTQKFIGRLIAVDEGGDERLLGEYTFNHTRTLP